MAVLNKGHGADPLIATIVAGDKTPWYKKPNLRYLYLWLFICCMGVEMTSGFDSQLINSLQFSPPFNSCTFIPWPIRRGYMQGTCMLADGTQISARDTWIARERLPLRPTSWGSSTLATNSGRSSRFQLPHGSRSAWVDDGRS